MIPTRVKLFKKGMAPYLISLEKESYERVYKIFNDKYPGKLQALYPLLNENMLKIYDINGVAVILDATTNEDDLKRFGNIDFIGSKEIIDETIKEIKQKGFSLEKITN